MAEIDVLVETGAYAVMLLLLLICIYASSNLLMLLLLFISVTGVQYSIE